MRTLWLMAYCSAVGVTAFASPSTRGGRALADPPVKTGKVELVIGGENEERAGYDFGFVSGLEFDTQGRIFVSDAKEANVRAFSNTGTLLFTMGRKGAGPGEFYSPQNIVLSPDGLLWVEDGGNRRFTVLSPVPPAGKVVRSLPRNSNSGSQDRIHWDGDGNIVILQGTGAAGPGQAWRVFRTFVDGSGATVRSDTAPAVSPDSSDSWIVRTNGGVATYSKPFAAQRLTAFGGRGFAAFATNTRYAVRIVDSHGRQMALVKRELPTIKLGPAEIAEFAAAKTRIATLARLPESSLDGNAPQSKPTLAGMWFDCDGRLWVEQAVPRGNDHKADVYATDGRWLAVMTWPTNVTLSYGAIRGDVGLGVARNSEDLQSVVRIAWK